ncbi:MAG: ATP-binding cassette domain-containing protein [Terracidiphilus sp.]
MRTEQRAVVEDASLTIESGETLGLVGESGSGKTTLARMILGLVEPSRGAVRVDGIEVARASRVELRRLRRQMQPVFQDPYAALNPRMKVLQIVTEPWVIHGSASSAGNSSMPGVIENRAAPRVHAGELLKEVGLDDSALDRFPHEFSGGQRQRINIARALALRPKLLILDEPVSALDVSVGAQIVNLLRRLQREHGLTYLFISHSMPLVRYLSTRIAVMERGRLVETGEAEALCASPREAYTQQLLAATPELPMVVV